MPNFLKTALIYLAVAAVFWFFSFICAMLVNAMQSLMERTRSSVACNLLLPVNHLIQFLLLFFTWGRFVILPMIFFGFNGHIITWYCSLVIAGLFVYGTIGAGEFWVVNYNTLDVKWYGVALQMPVSFSILSWPVYLAVRSFFDVQYGLNGWALYVCLAIYGALSLFLLVFYTIQFYKLYQKSHNYL